jgi:hypothetical protein
MKQNTNFQEILSKEFGCYYIADGFEAGWENSIQELAHDSSIRLSRQINNDDIQEFVTFLQELSTNPEHSLVETLSDETLIDWTGDLENWRLLQQILNSISTNLEAR